MIFTIKAQTKLTHIKEMNSL